MLDRSESGLAALVWRLLRAGRNGLHNLVVEQPVRLFAVMLVIGVVWLLIFGLTWGIIEFLSQERYRDLKVPLLRALLNLFFFALFFLVMISNALVVWSALFRTQSALYQAQLPLTNRALFWSASVEGGLWASWAVVVLAVPLVAGLALEAAQPTRYIPAALAVLFGFLACCIAGGVLGAVLLARIIPLLRRGWKGFLLIGVGLVVALIFFLLGSYEAGQRPDNFLREIIGRISFIENPYLPPLWAQRGMDAATISYWPGLWYYLGLLVSTAIGLALIAEFIAVRRLRLDMDLLCGRGDRNRRGRSKPWRLLFFLPKDLALLVAKDLRLFLRDPSQVLQFGLFFGMLTFYIALLPRIGMVFTEENWPDVVSVLNLTAVSMALATFTGRFVFPLLSLEGKRLWVLILAPWKRTRIVTAKFTFAMLVGVPISIALVCLSGAMLQLSWVTILYQGLVTLCMGLGLSAGALGLGARMADYNEDNPAKLVAGYGGTVNLLASLVYAALLVFGAAVPLVLHNLGPWRWAIGLGWLVVITSTWTAAGLIIARRWFGRTL